MFLKRLEISGFKSFAGKTTLEFELGTTAIVGPNGSGKSNIADAIRWVLGEQSTKTLRGKKNEELIFAGTQKRAKASLAEVKMIFDNSDSRLPIDYSEVQISRMVYRSGETEYRLNGSKVKAGDIQQLMAQAGFGPSSYSVIAQGTIDTFILATPAERKLLFDEASGIRQYEIKREQALKRLEATEGNEQRVRDILTELDPRLRSLEKSVEAAKERTSLQAELQDMRRRLVSTGIGHHTAQLEEASAALEKFKSESHELESQIAALESDRRQLETAGEAAQNERGKVASELQSLEVERDELSSDISVKRAELAFLQEQNEADSRLPEELAEYERQLVANRGAQEGVRARLAKAQEREAAATAILDQISEKINAAQSQLTTARRQANQSTQQEYISHALGILRSIAHNLADGKVENEELKLMVYKAGRLLGFATVQGQNEMLAEIKSLQGQLSAQLHRRESSHEKYTHVVIQVRSLELDLAHLEQEEVRIADRAKAREGEQSERASELAANLRRRLSELAALSDKLDAADARIQELRKALSESGGGAPQTQAIFALAADLEAHRSRLSQVVRDSAGHQEAKSQHATERARFEKLAHKWFPSELLGIGQDDDAKGLENLEREVMLLEARITDSKQADMDALDEYEEVGQRFHFLSSQVEDLSQAKQDLVRIIGELEKLIKDRFESAFTDISDAFETHFNQLFDGGRAKLTLTKDEAGAYGINITAIPPGKRVESLAMLSGGERTLTGIALLAAILSVNPSPFVVLDEVDAALDEANSGRFATILEHLAKQSQFIVITHNRQIMRAAHTLFGVTMDKNHVSSLLSLKLEEAAMHAARS